MEIIDTILNLALIAATLYLARGVWRAVNYKPEPSKVELETQQAIARIENLLHHFIEQKAARVSDEVDTLLTGGFEVSRGTPFQKEQRAAGNAVSAGIPHGIIEPKFSIGEILEVIDEGVSFKVSQVWLAIDEYHYCGIDAKNHLSKDYPERKLRKLQGV